MKIIEKLKQSMQDDSCDSGVSISDIEDEDCCKGGKHVLLYLKDRNPNFIHFYCEKCKLGGTAVCGMVCSWEEDASGWYDNASWYRCDVCDLSCSQEEKFAVRAGCKDNIL